MSGFGVLLTFDIYRVPGLEPGPRSIERSISAGPRLKAGDTA